MVQASFFIVDSSASVISGRDFPLAFLPVNNALFSFSALSRSVIADSC